MLGSRGGAEMTIGFDWRTGWTMRGRRDGKGLSDATREMRTRNLRCSSAETGSECTTVLLLSLFGLALTLLAVPSAPPAVFGWAAGALLMP